MRRKPKSPLQTGEDSVRFVMLALLPLAVACAQTAPSAPPPAKASGAQPAPGLVYQVIRDQAAIFTSPARIHVQDLKWLLPLAGSVGWLLNSDERNMRESIRTNPLARDRSMAVSDVSVGSLAAVPALLYWWGWRHGNVYAQRTGALTARAVADTAIATEILRGITWRQRPMDGTGSGGFFAAKSISSSFPSLHAGAAWAIASVVAQRYPGWLTQAGVYGLASAVSISRVTAREHFPSDVAVGSALGWLIGRYVSRPARFQEPRTGRDALAPAQSAPEAVKPEAGGPYVPMDNWVYGALDRLAALGLIPSQISGLRPWTRAECRRQVLEAEKNLQKSGEEAADLVAALRGELDSPGTVASSITLQSVYTRNGVIAGPALNDSFHFGQTWIDNNGRPFGRGWNSYTGFAASAKSGRFFAFVNGEYQHAPGRDPYDLQVRQAISSIDDIPLQAAEPRSDTNRFRAIEAYAGFSSGDLEFSVGKQALWWGPTYDAPLSFSNNAEPTKNLKISTAHPFHLWLLGEVRGEFVMGKLGGQQYTWRPWFNAQKVSFKLTENLEIGFSRWAIFWGVGHPITVRSFIRDFTSTNSPTGGLGVGSLDPGDRKGGFDFRYRIPGLRKWLTLYSDSYCDDDPSPLAAPRRAAINPGIYLVRVPGIPRLDFRVEAPSTTLLGLDNVINYYNNQYLSGNTNYGNLVGSWVGRDGRAIEAWSAYSFSPRNRIELGFRDLKVSAKLLPGGATQCDGTLRSTFALAPNWYANLFVQYEKFDVPLLGPRRSNLSGWMQLTWEPDLQIAGKRN